VLIACLLGAQAAVVSRPVLSALAGGGEQGVEATLRSMIDATMAMTLWMGAGRIDALTQDQLVTADGRPVAGGKNHG
jgi:isopentenyl diphosphate isomerase/L-lactate dehydrogenase-like FMN-dependent dehydrogenase